MVTEKSTCEVPDWVPYGVRRAAQSLFDGDQPAQAAAAVTRLLCDPRMEAAWRELTKRKREEHVSNTDPFHPSQLPRAVESWQSLGQAESQHAAEFRELGDEESAGIHEERAAMMSSGRLPDTSKRPSAQEQEQLALALIFFSAIAIYCAGYQTISRKDLGAWVDDLRSAGKNDIADAYERHAAQPQNAKIIVGRRRTDPRIEAFIELMASQTRETFGAVLPTTIATITNVVFEGADFNRDAVRAILKDRRGSAAA